MAEQTNAITVEDVNSTLENSLKNIFETERFMELLKVMASHKSYSLNNTILIATQKPYSTMVMGFKDWQKLGRFVNKGEKAIKILAPLVKKMDMEVIDKETKKPKLDEKGQPVLSPQKVIAGFKLVSVFDVAQTNGKEIPSVKDFIIRELKNDDYMSKLYVDYTTFLKDTKKLNVREDITDKGVGGYFARDTHEIVVSSTENKNDTQKFRVLIHEYAHSLLHNKDSDLKMLPRGHKEAQAESVAFVVSNYYGLDTSAISTGYIATWSQDVKLARQALSEIQETANLIIDDINALQKDKIQSFYKDQSLEYDQAKNYLIKTVGISEKVFDPMEKTETSIQLINKENGYLLSGKLEYSEKNEMFFLRTNRNLIEPLSNLSESGNLRVLNVEKELGEINLKDVARIPDHYEVKKIRNAGYVVQSTAGKDIISEQFAKKDDAINFKLRAAIGQALHNKAFFEKKDVKEALKDDIQQVVNSVENQINKTSSAYLTHYSKSNVAIKGVHGVSVGWAILRNPEIKTVDDLQNFSEKNKHVPTYKNLVNAMENIKNERNSEMELERVK